MKNFTYLLLVALFILSCSEENDTKPVDKSLKLRLEATKTEGNIFELIDFNINFEGNPNLPDITLADIINVYDSIVWKVSGNEKRFKILEFNNSSSEFTFGWGHNFFQPAEYETILIGYKDDAIIYSDTLVVTISNNKDFLGYNWKDITATSEYYSGIVYADVLSSLYELATSQDIHEGTPSVSLFYKTDINEEQSIFSQKSEKQLFDFISSLYSTPIFDQNDANALSENYNKLFKYKATDASPKSIWITPKSKIVLLESVWIYGKYYYIYAEPNNG